MTDCIRQSRKTILESGTIDLKQGVVTHTEEGIPEKGIDIGLAGTKKGGTCGLNAAEVCLLSATRSARAEVWKISGLLVKVSVTDKIIMRWHRRAACIRI